MYDQKSKQVPQQLPQLSTVVPLPKCVVRATSHLLHRPRPPPPPPQACNACPTLTGFVPPAGLRYRTRLGKSHYTWVTALDSLIRDSKERIRAYYNTGFAAFPPKNPTTSPSLLHFQICSLSQISALFGHLLSSFFSHEKALWLQTCGAISAWVDCTCR